MKQVTKAIIPVGGYGTRFLPLSKSIPKEMLPLGNKPVVLHVVEECVASGITDIIFVVSNQKHALEKFFSPTPSLEEYFERLGKKEEVRDLRRISNMANFTFVFTKYPNGNGGSIMVARHLIGDEPFVLVWGDELICCKGKPRILQCIETYQKYQVPVVSTVKIHDPSKLGLYGIAEIKPFKKERFVRTIVDIVEKPAPGKAPSEYASHGAYVLPADIFEVFDKMKHPDGLEIYLTDLINVMKKKTGLLARIIPDGHYLDCGNPDSYLLSQIEYALLHADPKSPLVHDMVRLLSQVV